MLFEFREKFIGRRALAAKCDEMRCWNLKIASIMLLLCSNYVNPETHNLQASEETPNIFWTIRVTDLSISYWIKNQPSVDLNRFFFSEIRRTPNGVSGMR